MLIVNHLTFPTDDSRQLLENFLEAWERAQNPVLFSFDENLDVPEVEPSK